MEHRVRTRPEGKTPLIEERIAESMRAIPIRAARDLSLDINTAQVPRLKSLTGIGDHYAKKIVEGRPYHHREELLTREILPAFIYGRIMERLVAGQS
jgi:transcriptional accessory protein Tex/SPT6